MTEIQLYHVTKVFGKKIVAVDDVSLTIEDGEYVTLIGPSGCGKTTTLRLIAGTILPTKGKIYFDNVSMENMPIQERHIGFVFQHFAVFPHMTVRENVAYGPTVRGKSKKEIEYLTESALKSVGLSDRAEVYPKELSAPELQQTALARVLASESRILRPAFTCVVRVAVQRCAFTMQLLCRIHLKATMLAAILMHCVVATFIPAQFAATISLWDITASIWITPMARQSATTISTITKDLESR